jgi:SAM-dependent methyltransferase
MHRTDSPPCRVCGLTARLDPLYSFGEQPVAGYLEIDQTAARRAARFPLEIGICGSCGLVQQMHDAARELLIERVYSRYHATYSASQGVSTYSGRFVARAVAEANATAGDRVIEIGSNDGAMLRLLIGRGLKPVGFEPSGKLNAEAGTTGADIVEDYFTSAAAATYRERFAAAKLVVSRHTLEHAFDPLDFVRGMQRALAPDGLAVVEVPYLPTQLVNNHFESMTFQHVCFFTAGALQRLFEAAGLTVVDLALVAMDGGSIVVFARHLGSARAPAVDAFTAVEETLHLQDGAGFSEFFGRVDRLRRDGRSQLAQLAASGQRVIAYGAGSKGQSLLNLLDLGPDVIPFVRDDTVQGGQRWIPGTGTPVLPGDAQEVRNPDIVLISAPTHLRELVDRDPFNGQALYVATTPSWHFVPRGRI